MNKTVTITLNGIIFHIEEEAYEKLKGYLDSVGDYFRKSGDSAEIISDMETSIADKFSEKINNSKNVITIKDVEDLIKVMGTVNDFVAGVSEDELHEKQNEKEYNKKEEKAHQTEKKLYRDPDDVIIAGVCSGIAAYFSVDPVLIRLVFFVSIFFGGAGILAYLILWIIMPVAKTNTQKLEMQGAIITLKKLEEIAKEKAAGIKKKASNGEINRLLSLPFRFIGAVFGAIGSVIKKVVPIISMVIGILVIIGCVFTITVIGMIAAVLVFNIDSTFINLDIPIQDIAGSTQYYLGVVSGALIALIPLFFIIIIGVALVERKNVFNAIFNSILIGLWMVSIITFGVVAVDLEPRIEEAIKEYEIAERTVREYDLKDFRNVYISGSHEAIIVPGDEFKITASGREKDIDRLDLSVKDEQLKIKSSSPTGICLFCNFRGVDFEIIMPELDKIALSGATRITASNFSSEDFEAILSGASEANLQVITNNFVSELSGASKLEFVGSSSAMTTEMSGASKIIFDVNDLNIFEIKMSGASKAEMHGRTEVLKAEMSGASKIFGFDFLVDEANIEASGASKAELTVSKKLFVDADSGSKIYYRGDADIVKNPEETSMIDDYNEREEQDGEIYRVNVEELNKTLDKSSVNDDVLIKVE